MIISINKLSSGPLVRGVEDTTYRIKLWGRAKPKKNISTVLVARIKTSNETKYSDYKEVLVSEINDYIEQIEFTDLNPGTRYDYQIGCYYTEDFYNSQPKVFDWYKADKGSFKTDGMSLPLGLSDINSDDSDYLTETTENDNIWSFAFSSCRIHMNIGPVSIMGTGKKADKIYRAVLETKPDIWLEIGDQVYFDYFNPVYRLKKLKDMRKLYRWVRSYPHIKRLYANCIIYQMCDDHDIHRDNSNHIKKVNDLAVWEYGVKCFYEYQHMHGPSRKYSDENNGLGNDHLWYYFYRRNATFFVIDSRSERSEGKIVSDHQLNTLIDWLHDPAHEYLIKFIVSPTPVVSQKNEDSWFGFPVQQRKLLEATVGLDNVFILTGDAHCARTAVYQFELQESNENHVIHSVHTITEIMSSGLYSVTGDKGKRFNFRDNYINGINNFDIDAYDKNNDFPYILDNSSRGGLKLITVHATDTYPQIKTPYGVRVNVDLPFRKRIDCIFTKVTIELNKLIIRVYNQKGVVLDTNEIQLRTRF